MAKSTSCQNREVPVNMKIEAKDISEPTETTRDYRLINLFIDFFFHNYLKSVIKYRPSTIVGLLSAICFVFNLKATVFYEKYLKNLSFTKKVILSAIFCVFLNE